MYSFVSQRFSHRWFPSFVRMTVQINVSKELNPSFEITGSFVTDDSITFRLFI